MTAESLTPEELIRRYERARQNRSTWESHWQDCYDFALPRRDGALSSRPPGAGKRQSLYDGTAPDAVEQLAAALLAELTPTWSRWMNFKPGIEIDAETESDISEELEQLSRTVQGHFDRSNFQIEIHQCYLDLVTIGTACLLFEEMPIGEAAAFKFTAIPISEIVMEEGPSGRLDTIYRRCELTESQIAQRFPQASLPERFHMLAGDGDETRIAVLEAVVPDAANRYRYSALALDDETGSGDPMTLAEGTYERSPFISFRWLKAPGEFYGRSPVMKVLPDIKTANKVVELMLKNASIAVTGIWQADDDGVLNPAAIRLVPGTIIPKAVGSQGLQPLQPANDFNLSETLLQGLRERIRHGLLVDQLQLAGNPQMTATEVMERTAAMTRMLGATFGRLQAELIHPLAQRALAILVRRGEAPTMALDGRLVEMEVTAPLARRQRMEKAAPLLQWLNLAGSAGPAAMAAIDMAQASKWLAEAMSVPPSLLASPEQAAATTGENAIGAALQAATGAQGGATPDLTQVMEAMNGAT
ncbi:portal protein [Aestuariispira ectoiniformans]|uniref:portal protein n=1 Tax=Aestuariispira ectoiniformans TaxID=2775080 RepID=UPI00223B45AF|nr:portal protein [Aestuariispira ectoiniformans]